MEAIYSLLENGYKDWCVEDGGQIINVKEIQKSLTGRYGLIKHQILVVFPPAQKREKKRIPSRV